MLDYVEKHPEQFDELIELALSNKQPYSWRAAWLLWSCIKKNDIRLQKHVSNIIEKIDTVNDSQSRELLKTIFLMEVDETLEGKLFNICINIWENTNKAQSVRYNAFKIILKITNKYPELKEELNYLTGNEYFETLSKGIKYSLLRMIK
jgi:hypothetical protein